MDAENWKGWQSMAPVSGSAWGLGMGSSLSAQLGIQGMSMGGDGFRGMSIARARW